MAMMHRSLTYEIRHANPKAGDKRMAAHARCANCGRFEFVTVGNNGGNPEYVAKRFVEHGWEFSQYTASKCICATCIAERKAAPIKEALGLPTQGTVHLNSRAPINPTVATAMVESVGMPGLRTEGPAKREDTKPMATMTEGEDAKVDGRAVLNALLPAVRTAIRNKLDAHFDDSRGLYLDGQSDHRIAEELDVPALAVSTLREMAYGPLTADPALDEVTAVLAQATESLGDIQGRLRNVAREIDALKKTHSNLEALAQSIQGNIESAQKKLDEARRRIGLK